MHVALLAAPQNLDVLLIYLSRHCPPLPTTESPSGTIIKPITIPTPSILSAASFDKLLEHCKGLWKHDDVLLVSDIPSLAYCSICSFLNKHPEGGIVCLGASFAHNDPPYCVPSAGMAYLPCLIHQGALSPAQVILVGTRNPPSIPLSCQKAPGRLAGFPMTSIAEEGVQEVSFSLMESCRQFTNMLVIMDLNVIDPAFAPGVYHPAPGGLSSREALHLLSKLMLLPQLRGLHVIGYTPEHDINGLTASLAAVICSLMSKKTPIKTERGVM